MGTHNKILNEGCGFKFYGGIYENEKAFCDDYGINNAFVL